MTDVMIDIETLSTNVNALILTIGAIKFDSKLKCIKPIEEMQTFYKRIEIDSCLKLGMNINDDTVKWWDNQDESIREEVFCEKDRVDIKEAIIELAEFIKDCKYVWANSPNFDCVILENAFSVCNISVPWKFWNLRDTRTVYALANTRLKDFSNLTAHNALNDCYNQILCLQESYKKLKL